MTVNLMHSLYDRCSREEQNFATTIPKTSNIASTVPLECKRLLASRRNCVSVGRPCFQYVSSLDVVLILEKVECWLSDAGLRVIP